MPEKENINCNLCGQNNYSVIFEEQPGEETQPDFTEKYRASGDEPLFEQVVKCNNCGLVYINPRNKAEEILEGYSKGSDLAHISQAEGREKTFKKSLKLIKKYAKYHNRLLDIGAAGGSFLKVVKDDGGWGIHGVEPNRWMCECGKEKYGIDIKQGDIFSANYDREIFDVVTLWDVIEHTPDPKAVLKECRKLLNPSGIIVVNIPDISTWLVKAMGRKWPFWSSVHLYYFTKKTMVQMLDEAGFDVIKIKRHFQYLQIGYIAKRFSQINKFISNIACFFVSLLHIGNFQIPYYLGQTLIIGKRK